MDNLAVSPEGTRRERASGIAEETPDENSSLFEFSSGCCVSSHSKIKTKETCFLTIEYYTISSFVPHHTRTNSHFFSIYYVHFAVTHSLLNIRKTQTTILRETQLQLRSPTANTRNKTLKDSNPAINQCSPPHIYSFQKQIPLLPDYIDRQQIVNRKRPLVYIEVMYYAHTY